jgi:PAS domain-containing protein
MSSKVVEIRQRGPIDRKGPNAHPRILLVVADDDNDLIRHAELLAQDAQDLLSKTQWDGLGFGRAVRNALARESREVAVSNDNSRARVTPESIGDAVLSTDSNWRVSFINPIAEKVMGWTSADAVGQHLSEVFQVLDGVSRERLGRQMERAMENGRPSYYFSKPIDSDDCRSLLQPTQQRWSRQFRPPALAAVK